MNEHDVLVERAVRDHRTVLLIGGLDSGKSTLAKTMLRAALEAGRTAAFLDGDVGQKSVGPPATVALQARAHARGPRARARWRRRRPRVRRVDLAAGPPAAARHRRSRGCTTGAREEGADLVVVDTSGLVSGIYGQLVKYHKVELLQPDLVVGLQRGEELDPLLGVIQRFFATEVVPLGVHPAVVAHQRGAAGRAPRGGDAPVLLRRALQRFRIKPTVFMPTLPPLFDLAQLDRLLVGLSDGEGAYTGIGYLEHSPEEGVLRLISPVADAAQGA